MTSSDPDETVLEPAAAAMAPDIARGHLHPGMLFLRFLDGLRQMVVPAAIGLLAQALWLPIAAGVFFVLAMIYAFARYITFQYRLTRDELITTEGILHRQERRIPINRIQDLSLEATIVRRICGLVVVSVETASRQGAEARLDSLSRRDAERLRRVLFETKAGQGGLADPISAPAPPTEQVLFVAGPGELTLLGLTNNRIGVIFAGLYGLYELVDQLGLGPKVGGLAGGFLARVAELDWTMALVLVVVILFLALLGGWIVSIVASFVMFHGFTLSVREAVFQRRYGLLTRRAGTLPRRRIQRVLLEQSFLRRLFGLTVLRADSAGSGMSPAQEARGARDIVVPLARNDRAEALVPSLLAGFEVARITWSRVSSLVVLRIFLEGCLLVAALLGLGLPTLGLPALWALGLLPLALAVGVLSYQNLAYARTNGHFAMRWGVLGRYRALVPLRKVQAVVTWRSPLERLLGLARLTVYVAGGLPTTMPNLPVEDAARLAAEFAADAAASRFVW